MTAPTDPTVYEAQVGTDFALTTAEGPPRLLRLVAVKRGIDDEVQRVFSLHFTSPGPVIPQETYEAVHAVLGRFALFLTPVQGRRRELVYEAVFNLLHDLPAS